MGNHRCFRLTLTAVLIILFTVTTYHSSTQAQSRDTSYQTFTDNFNSYNASLWHMANGWTNGAPFDCGWLTDHVFFTSGIMSLQLDNNVSTYTEWHFASGEYRSNGHYQYGTYTVRMKAVNHDGVVSSFFIYTGPSESNPWDEIDIEITGKVPTQLQTNYYTDGVGGHEHIIELGFDASADFHTYSIVWMPESISWYVDEDLKHTENGSNGALPTTPGRIMMNFWPGTDTVYDWLGDFVYSEPISAQYDWVSFEPVDWPNKNYLPLAVH